MRKAKLLLILYIIVVWIAVIVWVTKQKPEFTTYIIQPDDTLYSISVNANPNTDWRILSDKIRYYNKIGPVLHPGQAIKIPVKRLNKMLPLGHRYHGYEG